MVKRNFMTFGIKVRLGSDITKPLGAQGRYITSWYEHAFWLAGVTSFRLSMPMQICIYMSFLNNEWKNVRHYIEIFDLQALHFCLCLHTCYEILNWKQCSRRNVTRAFCILIQFPVYSFIQKLTNYTAISGHAEFAFNVCVCALCRTTDWCRWRLGNTFLLCTPI